jgi:beta-lactamase regulating signal transducer with metallopeptidase domain
VTNLLDRIDQSAVAAALLGLESGAAATATGAVSPAALLDWRILGVAWLVGAVLFLCVHLIAYRVTMRRLRRWSVPVTDPFILRIFAESKRRLHITRDVALFQTAQPILPMLAGLARPCVYIPDRQLSATECAAILSHELCHYRRRDLWLKLALLLAHAIHWFNPAMPFLLRQIELDVEMACDQDVLRGANRVSRRQYGLTILSFLEEAQPVPAPLTTNFIGGKKQMKSRFSDILSQTKKKPGIIFAALALLIVVFCGAWSGNGVAATAVVATVPVVQATLDVANTDDVVEPVENRIYDPEAVIDSTIEDPENFKLAWPLPDSYTITSPYGTRYGGSDFHTGMDIGAGEDVYGSPVIAAFDGQVYHVTTEYTPGMGYGQYVCIYHFNNGVTLYAHLSEILVQEGDKVEQGQVIGKVGSTGYSQEPHLHFEVHAGTKTYNPAEYLMAR